jgi:hypothetical protein
LAAGSYVEIPIEAIEILYQVILGLFLKGFAAKMHVAQKPFFCSFPLGKKIAGNFISIGVVKECTEKQTVCLRASHSARLVFINQGGDSLAYIDWDQVSFGYFRRKVITGTPFVLPVIL